MFCQKVHSAFAKSFDPRLTWIEFFAISIFFCMTKEPSTFRFVTYARKRVDSHPYRMLYVFIASFDTLWYEGLYMILEGIKTIADNRVVINSL